MFAEGFVEFAGLGSGGRSVEDFFAEGEKGGEDVGNRGRGVGLGEGGRERTDLVVKGAEVGGDGRGIVGGEEAAEGGGAGVGGIVEDVFDGGVQFGGGDAIVPELGGGVEPGGDGELGEEAFAKAMEGGDGSEIHVGVIGFGDTGADFVGGLFGEGEGEDVAGRDVLAEDKPGEAFGEDAGFAGTGASDDADVLAGAVNGGVLLGSELHSAAASRAGSSMAMLRSRMRQASRNSHQEQFWGWRGSTAMWPEETRVRILPMLVRAAVAAAVSSGPERVTGLDCSRRPMKLNCSTPSPRARA